MSSFSIFDHYPQVDRCTSKVHRGCQGQSASTTTKNWRSTDVERDVEKRDVVRKTFLQRREEDVNSKKIWRRRTNNVDTG